ncbi:hypothetical protein SDJN02_11647 [Cucurbita argyrosperma subsp. argyrosperma]|nr:hypothetical protein SDJN02_11647 [Cucurbita argyrosperma subsp. argyrosperma]
MNGGKLSQLLDSGCIAAYLWPYLVSKNLLLSPPVLRFGNYNHEAPGLYVYYIRTKRVVHVGL